MRIHSFKEVLAAFGPDRARRRTTALQYARPARAVSCPPPLIEGLEGRLFLTTAAINGSGFLVITGTSIGETIEVYQKSSTGQVTVFSDQVSKGDFTVANFTKIVVNAGGGDDFIAFGSTDPNISTGSQYGASYDVPVSKPAEVHGDAGDDFFFGTDQADTLEGGIGGDSIWGGAGNDVIRGDDGDDNLMGQSGNDTMYGGLGYDTLDGGIDNDLMYGGNGDGDSLDASDTLFGKEDNDRLYGDAGNDSLNGGTGADYMYGGDGNDSLNALDQDSAADTLDGGTGTQDYGGVFSADGDSQSNIELVLS